MVRKKRQEHGWTQTQLAKRLGVTQGKVSEMERGKAPLDIEGLKRELDIDPDELLAAVAFDDAVIRAIWGHKLLSEETKKALVTIYELVLKAEQQPD